MRILILGDSLAFPQPKRGQRLETTWPVLLRESLGGADVWQRAKPRHCIKDVWGELHFFTESLTHFDAVIVQTGIVDCSPRPYPHWFYRLLEVFVPKSPLRTIERFAHQHLLWIYGFPWVSVRRFSERAKAIAQRCAQANPSIKIVFVTIAPPSKALSKLLPGVETAASRYNASLKEATELGGAPHTHCLLVDPYAGCDPVQATIEDGQHMTCESHRRLATLLANELRNG